MVGRTHYKAGVLFYLIFSMLLSRWLPRVSIVGVIVAAAAALLPDLDSGGSMINRRNPVMSGANRLVDLLDNLIKIVFTGGIGVALIYFQEDVSAFMRKVHLFPHNEQKAVYAAAAVFIAAGLLGGELSTHMPLVRDIVKGMERLLDTARKFISVVIYAAVGAALVSVNIRTWHDPLIYGIAFIPALAVLTPHRSFTHSVEGAAVFVFGAWRVFIDAGCPGLVYPFAIGYLSHLYLTDMLTKEGVPISFLPYVLKKTPLHARLKRNGICGLIYRVLDTRVSFAIARTGSGFETAYIIVIALVAVMIWAVQARGG